MPLYLPQYRAPSMWQADDDGFIAEAYDREGASSSGLIMTPAGTVFGTRLYVPTPRTITNLHIWLTAAGATLTASQCLGALYQNNTLLGTTVNQATAWLTTGLQTMALTATAKVSTGYIDVGWWYNGTTAPTLLRGSAIAASAGTASFPRHFSANTLKTTTAPSPLGAKTITQSQLFWAAVS